MEQVDLLLPQLVVVPVEKCAKNVQPDGERAPGDEDVFNYDKLSSRIGEWRGEIFVLLQ